MKRIFNVLIALSVFGSIALFTSCGSDDPDPVAGPSIFVELVSGGTADGTVISAESGATLTFEIDITAPGGFNVFRILDGNNQTILEESRNDLGLDAGTTVVETLTRSITLAETEVDATAEFTFVAVDDVLENTPATETFTVNVTGAPSIDSFTAILLGGPQNTTDGSYYNVIDNTVYLTSEAFTVGNTDKVDLVFWYGSTSLYAIGSVDDATAQTAFDSQAGISLDNLNPKSLTRFKTFIAVQDFDAIDNGTELNNVFNSDGTGDLTNVTDLAVGDVFAFTLDTGRGGKKGFIKVVEILGTGPTDRGIKIDVKVEK